MNRIFFILLVNIFGIGCSSNIQLTELFVDQSSNANDEGTAQSSFPTIADAIQKASELKSINPNEKIIINILSGVYYLKTPISIPATLSGLTISGSDALEVSLRGSVPLQLDWKKWDENIYVATVADDLEFDQLVVNGKAQILARYPNYDESAHYWQGYAQDALSKERVASWEKPLGAYFHALHSGRWGGFHFIVTGVNEDGMPTLEGGHQNNRSSRPHKEYRMVENVLEELDSLGEWYLDKENQQLYYWPAKNLDLNNASFEGAILKNLIQVEGTLEDPVKNVTIRNIKFEQSQRTFMEEFEPLLRSDWTIYRGGALFFEGTENCVVENCEFTNLGGNVIMVSKYNEGLQIKGNHIHECGASAISFIGDVSAVRSPSLNYRDFVAAAEMDTILGPKNELYPRNCLVENNLIHRIGRVEKQTAGVQISMAMDISVRHNSIYDVPRAGINIGDGTWGGHILEYNDVFNTVLETSDHGSFNSWGRDRFWHPNRKVMDSLTTANPDMPKWDAIKTTVIRNNRFRCDHGWDIDLDDGSSNYHIYNNLCLNNGIKLREGFNRVVENNITVNNSLHPHVWFENSEDVFKYNIVGDAYQDVMLKGWGKELDYNLFPTEAAMRKSQIYDRDMNSAFGNPLFIHPEALDFRVIETSPALEIGFENFPMDQFGVSNSKLKSMVKTPEVPTLEDAKSKDGKRSPAVAWLRNDLKNIDSEQEQSAYGLNAPEGVIVLKVWKNSPAVQNNGLEKGDVILEFAGEKVSNVIDFLKINKKYQVQEKVDILVMRNQAEQKLKISIK